MGKVKEVVGKVRETVARIGVFVYTYRFAIAGGIAGCAIGYVLCAIGGSK